MNATIGLRLQFSVAAMMALSRAQRFHQICNLDGFERTHGVLDIPARFRCRVISCQLIELCLDLVPGKWPAGESWVGRDLVSARLPALQPNGHPARALGRVACCPAC